ncbi:hypothetical protein [Streptomyces sp. AV19]|uniref:hypothetical protein n=1 Tax=Streptomyces sp. AV19 TaxID=2793068 RepID=UPI001F3380DB|nr:hypothetical protein [Streptomyces sp. AV19]MDG4533154.1 hypothetical protein [Streptomyces sp. AV19]
MPQALNLWQEAGVDVSPFHDGHALLRERYAELGLHHLLPLDRVLVAVRSTRPGAFGGFHHPNQGYRYLQMQAVITMYGGMNEAVPEAPALAVLDLLRAYAHDCLHYGSYRSYQLHGGEVVRTQYGLNFRRQDGRSYSAPDRGTSPTTRNIGVVMEGACDRESRSITRRTAATHGGTAAGINGFAFRDVTGQLDSADAVELAGAPKDPASESTTYLASMGRYEANVNTRYRAFLAEIGQAEAEDLHSLILSSTISGDMTLLCAWLDCRHGPGTFAAMFMAPGYLSVSGSIDLGGLTLAS